MKAECCQSEADTLVYIDKHQICSRAVLLARPAHAGEQPTLPAGSRSPPIRLYNGVQFNELREMEDTIIDYCGEPMLA